MYLLGVQMLVTYQFTREQQHRNLMAIAHFRRGVGIDVDHIDADAGNGRQRGEFAQHLLA